MIGANLDYKQKLEICELYINEKLSTRKIARKFSISSSLVFKILKNNNIKLRNKLDSTKKYSINREFFKKIDNKEKAYILGLCYSDGNVYKDSFTLYLQEQDKYILDQISKSIQFSGPLNFRPGKSIFSKISNRMINIQNGYILRIHDREFVNNLKKQGVFERKTSKIKFPYFLDKNLWKYFILGLIDGDGCISYNKRNYSLRLCIAGSRYIVNDILDIISDILKVKGSVRKPHKTAGNVVVYNKYSTIKILNWIYSDPPDFFLKRKYLKYKNAIIDTLNSKFPKKFNDILSKSVDITKTITYA